MTGRTEDAQSQALRAFLLLCALDPQSDAWPGKLLLVPELDAEGRAVSVAAATAGAACLALDARAEVCRATVRTGACDFVVNSVDEALRILKNEIRKRKPVSVAVAAAEQAALEELAARGVAPDVFVASRPDAFATAGERFAEFGTRTIAAGDAERLASEYMDIRGLEVREFQFASGQELSAFDQKLAATRPKGELLAQWAVLVPRFFYRDRPFRRVACLVPADFAKLSGPPSH